MASGKLTDRWRPGDFTTVVGQQDVVDWCRARLRENDPQNAIFYGPSGCGKNSVVRFYGRSLACGSPAVGGLACGKCEACRQPMDGSQNGFYAEVPCAEIKTKAALLEHLEPLKHAPWVGARRMLVIDEAHNLKPQLQNVFLRLLEKPQQDYVIVLLTTDIDAIIPAIKSRVSSQRFNLVSKENLIAYGTRVCTSESIKFDNAALGLVAEHSNGHVREFVQNIDDIWSTAGSLTEQDVRRHHGGGVDTAITVLIALLKGDLAQAAAALSKLNQAAADTADLFHRALTAIEYRARRIALDDDDLCTVAPVTLDALQEAVGRFSERDNVDPPRIWAEIHEIWRRSPGRSHSDLKAILLAVHWWLHERQAPRQPRRGAVTRTSAVAEKRTVLKRPHRRLRRSRDTDNSLEHAKRIWDSASLMSQVYGVYFNSRIIVRPNLIGFKDEAAGRNFVGYLIKCLVGRIQEWCGRDVPVHWIYTQTDVGLTAVYTIALALPADQLEAINCWLFDKFLPDQLGDLPAGAVSYRWAVLGSNVAQSRYQARLLQLLCRGVNGALTVRASGKRRPLVDAIGIPRRLRASASVCVGLTAAYVSKTIGRSEAKKWQKVSFPVLTPAKDGAWDYANPGWEIKEYEDRCDTLARGPLERTTFSPSACVTEDDDRAKQFDLGRLDRSVDAKHRFRSWPTPDLPGWW